jgi:hypothetical protein
MVFGSDIGALLGNASGQPSSSQYARLCVFDIGIFLFHFCVPFIAIAVLHSEKEGRKKDFMYFLNLQVRWILIPDS